MIANLFEKTNGTIINGDELLFIIVLSAFSYEKAEKYHSKHLVVISVKRKIAEKQSRAMRNDLKATKSVNWVIIWGFNSLELANPHLD